MADNPTPQTTPAPKRIRLSRAKGYRKPAGAIVVARPTRWGNPFDFRRSEYCWLALSFGCRGDMRGRMEASVRAFREWLTSPPGCVTREYHRGVTLGSDAIEIDIGPRLEITRQAPSHLEIREALRGYDLGCWCPLDSPCHADVLLAVANAPLECEKVKANG